MCASKKGVHTMAKTKEMNIEKELQNVDFDFFFGQTSPKSVEDGKVILDSNTPSDHHWYYADEEYDV